MKKLIGMLFLLIVMVANAQEINYEKDILKLIKKEKYDDAYPLLESYIKCDNPNPNAYYWLSTFNYYLGITDTSYLFINKALYYLDKLTSTITSEDFQKGKWKNYSDIAELKWSEYTLPEALKYYNDKYSKYYGILTQKLSSDINHSNLDSARLFLKQIENPYYKNYWMGMIDLQEYAKDKSDNNKLAESINDFTLALNVLSKIDLSTDRNRTLQSLYYKNVFDLPENAEEYNANQIIGYHQYNLGFYIKSIRLTMFINKTNEFKNKELNVQNVKWYLNDISVKESFSCLFSDTLLNEPKLYYKWSDAGRDVSSTIYDFLSKIENDFTLDELKDRYDLINLSLEIYNPDRSINQSSSQIMNTQEQPSKASRVSIMDSFKQDNLSTIKDNIDLKIQYLSLLKSYHRVESTNNLDSLNLYSEKINQLLDKLQIAKSDYPEEYYSNRRKISELVKPILEESLIKPNIEPTINEIMLGTTSLTKYSKIVQNDYGKYATLNEYNKFTFLTDTTLLTDYKSKINAITYYNDILNEPLSVNSNSSNSEIDDFINSESFQPYKNRYLNDVIETFDKIYWINGFDDAHLTSEYIPDYDRTSGGYTLLLSKFESTTTISDGNDYFDSGIVNRVKLNKLPLDIVKADDYSKGTNSLFIPVKNEYAEEIDHDKNNFGLLMYFKLGGPPQDQSYPKKIGQFWQTANVRVVAYNIKTNKIYYSRLYINALNPLTTSKESCEPLAKEFQKFVEKYVSLANAYRRNKSDSWTKMNYVQAKIEFLSWEDKLVSCKGNPKYADLLDSLFVKAYSATIDVR